MDKDDVVVPELWDVRYTFAEIHASVSTYLGAAHAPTRPVLALRAGGKQIIGTDPTRRLRTSAM